MAGYARASGRTGVCLAHLGPRGDEHGHRPRPRRTWTQIRSSSSRGRFPRSLIGNRRLSRRRTSSGSAALGTKHNYLVKETKDLARIIKEAFYIASTGRPGPVLVDMPKDVLAGSARYDLPQGCESPWISPHVRRAPAPGGKRGAAADVPGAAGRLRRGRRHPVERLRGAGGTFQRALPPCDHDRLMGMGGASPDPNPLSLGMLGCTGRTRRTWRSPART